jgi:AAA+ superfamily predicted ATPase
MVTGTNGLFDQIEEFPNDRAQQRFNALVGLDRTKQQLVAEACVLLDPNRLTHWSKKYHNLVIPAVAEVIDRTSLVILAGDVGTGKTELAETVGDRLARELNIRVTLLPLSLTARGHGAVGEMTTLITAAFEKTRELAMNGRKRDGKLCHGVILLIDEADAIAQSRELAQMHHEDRAGVNALIRGIDGLRKDHQAVLTILCTNRLNAIDPAVQRRAAAIYEFHRPDDAQRHDLLSRSFSGVSINVDDMSLVVSLTGPLDNRNYGATYSDLRQRFVSTVVLDAFPTGPITGARLVEIAREFQPTRPFDEGTTQ